MKKKVLSIILALVMVAGMVPFGAIPAFAEGKGSINITDGCDVGKSYGTYFSGSYDDSVFKITGTPTSSVNFNNITFENITCDEDGACVYIDVDNATYHYSTDFIFTNCRFINCSTTEDGGVVYVKNTTILNYVRFVNCTFMNCHANGDGGALYINSSLAEVYGEGNTVFSGCSADGDGGALYINSSLAEVYGKGIDGDGNTVISGCSAGDDGGGIYMNYGGKLDGFLLADNTATGNGGGICNTANGAVISNCRLYRNTCGSEGGGLYTDNATVNNCKFFENDCSDKGYELSTNSGSTQINNCTFTSKYSGDNVVYGGVQSNCTFPDQSSYQLTVGDGSKENPYLIKSTDDWDALHYMALKRARMYLDGTEHVYGDEYCLYGKYFRLDADITVCNTVGEVHDIATLGGAVLYTSYSEFNGIFDGNGHTVTYVSNTGSDRNGVFGYANSATVKNLTVNGYIKGGNRVGGIFGSTYNCTAESCTNNATVYGTISSLGDTASFIGGIVGHSECSNYIGCINNGKVEGTHEHIGGIAGYSNGDTVNGCTNNGNVVCFQKCGGIVGTTHGTVSLLNCINNADVMANYNYAGGLIGYEESDVTLENCIVNSTVSANSYANAITGYSAPGSKYEGIYYNKAKATGNFGIALSDNAMKGISADENGNLMPYCVNDYIKENDKSKDGWLYAAFNGNGVLEFVHDATAFYMGTDGLLHAVKNALQVTDSMTSLGEQGKNTAYYVDGTVTRNGRIQILGNVTLVLNDDCYYDVQGGIGLEKGNSLTVYSYSLGEHMGSMTAAANQKGAAAIGGNATNEWAEVDKFDNHPLNVYSEKHDCGDLTIYGGNIEAVAYNSGNAYGVGIGGSSLTLLYSYTHDEINNPIIHKSDPEDCYGGDGGKVAVYNGNLSVKATGAVGIGGGNGTKYYATSGSVALIDEAYSGGTGGTFAYYGGTVTVESNVAAFGKGRNGGGGRDDVSSSDMTTFTFTDDAVHGVAVGDALSGLNAAYTLNEAPNLNGEKCVKFDDWRQTAVPALEPTCETAGHKAYVLRTADNLYYEDACFMKPIGDTSALQAWISEGGDGYFAPLGHDWVYINENQHKCIHCEKTEPHTMGDDGCTKCNGFYYDYSIESHTFEKKAIPSGTKILSDFDGNYTLTGGWYLVHGDVTSPERITCTDDVHLILENGCNFTANKGIALETDVSLSVYAQSFDAEKMGKLTVTESSEWCAGIGSNQYVTCGNISIHGGVITAIGFNSAAGIGSGDGGSCGNISVYGGIITATGNRYVAGIGSGSDGYCGNISVYGGNITATGGNLAAGIGSGCNGSCSNISVCGGNITVTGGRLAAGIGSGSRGSCEDISICGGNITATGGEEAAGIGTGYKGSCGNISVYDGNITATGGEEAAGIGSGNGGSCESVAISDYLDITAGADKDSAQPVAAYNGEKYVHTELNTARKAPTCTRNGHIKFYINEGKYYSDADCTVEITDLYVWLNTSAANGGGMIPATGHDCECSASYDDASGDYIITEKCKNCDYTNEYTITEYNYIAAEKGAYINTGIKPTDKTRIVMDVYVNGGREYWFGAWDTDWNRDVFALGNDKNGEYSEIYAGYGNQGGGLGDGSLVSNGYHTVELDEGTVKIDGTAVKQYNTEDFSLANPLYLFAQNRAGSATAYADQNTIHCYGCEIYEDGTLVRKFVPFGNNEGVAGFMDVVNGVFYGNSGNAQMTALNDTHTIIEQINPRCTNIGRSAYYITRLGIFADENHTKKITDLQSWRNTPVAEGGGLIPALGHSWEYLDTQKHKCSVCKAEEAHSHNGLGNCAECGASVYTVTLVNTETSETAYSGNIDCTNRCIIESIANGTYIMTVSCAGMVARTYPIKVTDGRVNEEVSLNLDGDVNGDGVIDENDYQQAVNIALSSENAVDTADDLSEDTDYSKAVADFDKDGFVDVIDLALFERKIF